MFNKIKGTRDLNPQEMSVYELIRNVFISSSHNYNFNLIDTPIIEPSELYRRSVASSDIVKKEMYEFVDKGDRKIALRPEGTAGFVRALVENKWYATLKNNKFAYFGPMFRYERPQKGRQRQFYQAGVEVISDENAYTDAELIILASQILTILDLPYTLKINSIGTMEEREKYQKNLREYFSNYKEQLTEISLDRLENNVLRILDDRNENFKPFVKNAPKITPFLSEKSKKYFDDVLKILKENDIKYEIDTNLVRGLDYYDNVVFEFVSTADEAGTQATLIAGGRYSNLVSELGGPNTSAAGWGFGVDRSAELILDKKSNYDAESIDILMASTSEDKMPKMFSLANELRSLNIRTEFVKNPLKSKKIFEKAEKNNAKFVIFDDPAKENLFLVKSLESGDKIYFAYNEDGYMDLLDFLADNGLEKLNQIEIEEE
ncbi:histidine--tRNA ligase [Mycoplasmopsis opalescens]|uniref:histidine--tRNA ligase n=1 Tax=Mycoplasmopsis opalescens TaxID=114886 RepID=UPI0004A6BFFF|nr:histidine--tRNA ligase [Mycoplasmopsis opalescens]